MNLLLQDHDATLCRDSEFRSVPLADSTLWIVGRSVGQSCHGWDDGGIKLPHPLLLVQEHEGISRVIEYVAEREVYTRYEL